MKTIFSARFFRAIGSGFFCLISFMYVSCDMFAPVSGQNESSENGYLRLSFVSDLSEAYTRSGMEIPDTSDFLLTVSDSEGTVVYDGLYGDSPESMMVKPGNYTISVISGKFEKPKFSSPQFGDVQCVVVPPGGVADVTLSCTQINCGVRLEIEPEFLTGCPDGVLFLKSDEGRLMYSYSEKRAAYFLPGVISVVLDRNGKDEVLLSRRMEARQMLVIGISMASSGSPSQNPARENIAVSVDTSRVWLSERYVIGEDNGKGEGPSEALTVNQAMSSVGKEDVWVSGYIVGGDLTSASASYETPFSSRTCILLGPRSSVSSRSSCIAVQLPAGNVREDLNLVDNPNLLGKKIVIKGDIVDSYYGLVGLKNCSDYKK